MHPKIFISILFLGLSTNAIADWCAGDKFLILDMPMSERLNKAERDLKSTHDALSSSASRLKFDIQTRSKKSMQRLTAQFQRLSDETFQLCRSAKELVYPVRYQSIDLRDTDELNARVKLNLGLLAAYQHTASKLTKHKVEMKLLESEISAKKSIISVLLRQGKNQTTTDNYSVNQFVQGACMAVNESNDFIGKDRVFNLETTIAKSILAQAPGKHVDDIIAEFMSNCELEITTLTGGEKLSWGDKIAQWKNRFIK